MTTITKKRKEKKRFYFLIEIGFVKILTIHYAVVCRDCAISVDKIKLFANMNTKLFQEDGGLSRWQELLAN